MNEQARYCSWDYFAAEVLRLSGNQNNSEIRNAAALIAGRLYTETGFVPEARILEKVRTTPFDSNEHQSAVHALLQKAFDEAFRKTPAGPAFGNFQVPPSPAALA